MKLQVPFPVMITVILSVSALVFSIALTSFRLISHVQAAEAHLDSKAVITGGGVAYRMDVLQLRGDFERKMRQTLKTMAINCRQKDDGMVCSVDIPEVP
jgi:hypothetical protein